jgi:flagellar protein FlgJ
MTMQRIDALDPRSLDGLRQLVKKDGHSDEALRAASKQVETLFLQMMLKSMREATPTNPLFDSEQTKLMQELYDQQLASDLAQSRGIGLADALFRQLGGGQNKAQAIAPETRTPAAPIVPKTSSAPLPSPSTTESAAISARIGATVDAVRRAVESVPQHVRDFVENIWPHARAASQATGIPAHFMVAQAALETGWGAKQPKNADGTPSYNLFNIKAGRNWDGPTTARHTVSEYDGGNWQSRKAAFRAYASYEEAFADYARLLTGSPRYAGVLGTRDAAAFAQGLQDAGYATDPMYADKLMRIIGGNTLKNALMAT